MNKPIVIVTSKGSCHLRSKVTWILHAIIISLVTVAFYSCGSSKGSDIATDDPERAYAIAKSRYDKGEYLDAIDDFNLIKLRFSGSSIIDKAIYYLGMSYYKREEYILGLYEFEMIIKNYPSSSFAEDAKYMQAMSYYKLSPEYNLDQTYTRYAITTFQEFLELYPKSKRVYESEKRILELREKLAYKSYKSAELYFNLGNYRSALVYYDNILDEFFDTKYADDALYGKIQALIIKKKYEDAKKEIERFESKFADSTLLSRVKSLKNQIPF